MNNLTLFENLPETDEIKKKKKVFQNVLKHQLKRLMFKEGVSQADIYREALVPFSTLNDWFSGETEAPRLDENIKKVARYFGVSVDYLAYGTPVSEKDILIENEISDMEDSWEQECC